MDPLKKERQEPDPDETIFADIDVRKDRKVHIFNARLLLIGLAGFALYALLSNLDYFKGYRFVWQIFLIVFFIVVSFWAKSNPFVALLTALIFWVALQVAEYFSRPAIIGYDMMDILVNGLVIALLGLGIREAWKIAAEKKASLK